MFNPQNYTIEALNYRMELRNREIARLKKELQDNNSPDPSLQAFENNFKAKVEKWKREKDLMQA